ncbi:MAG: 30S ribosomal protein S3 [Candidatus Moranbacteria bacterium]|nr:30S ribosomal protein S3 [Candidatus Moranbacteria bacterium]
MGQKIDPRIFRIGINKTWKSRWYNDKNYQKNLQQDVRLRQELKEKLKKAGVASIEIERSVGKIRIVIHSSRPGVLIGRAGQGLEKLKEAIKKKYFFKDNSEVQLDVKEIKYMEENAQLLADDVAEQIEKRVSFRKAMKMTLDKTMKNRNVRGAKIGLSGRLGGAEMSRKEWLAKGSLPLHTLRANIDFAKSVAYTTYGTIGVKVWLYKKGNENNNQ